MIGQMKPCLNESQICWLVSKDGSSANPIPTLRPIGACSVKPKFELIAFDRFLDEGIDIDRPVLP
jgi:hypothetical protein